MGNGRRRIGSKRYEVQLEKGREGVRWRSRGRGKREKRRCLGVGSLIQEVGATKKGSLGLRRQRWG
jgi:hypothetical protein